MISGYVRDDSSQQAVGAARVELRSQGGAALGQSITSDTDGEFHLITASGGTYYIVVERSGYEVASVTVPGTSQSNVVIALHHLQSDSGRTAASLVSTRELSIPEKARTLFGKGSAALDKSDYERAISEFHRAIKELPSYYEAYTEMSIAQFRLGDATAAEKSLRTSVALSENQYAKSLTLLAALLNSQSRFAEAESTSRLAIAADEKFAAAYCQLARALSGLQHSVAAEIIARRALELEPMNPMFTLVLGNIHLQQHEYRAAVLDFDRYLGLAPTGAQSDLVRRTRDQANRVLAAERNAGPVNASGK